MESIFTAGWILISMVLVIVLSTRLAWNAFSALFIAALVLALATLSPASIIESLRTGFGNTVGSIGLLVLFGTILANTLETAGATSQIAWSMLRLTGPRRLPQALALTGLIAGIPIFCDAGFIVLSGLLPALGRSSPVPTPRLAATLATALFAVHCLTPTHPGALAAAENLGVDLGSYLLISIVVAVVPLLIGYSWIRWFSPAAGSGDPGLVVTAPASAPAHLPSPFLAFLPIVLPLALIALGSILEWLGPQNDQAWWLWLKLTGQPIMALAIGALLGLLLFFPRQPQQWNRLIDSALTKAGPILLITGAGGMYGQVIKATGVGDELGSWLATQSWGLLTPFLLAALLKTAQGSSTVAIITTSALIAPLMAQFGWVSTAEKTAVLLALAGGSMVVSHTNDSYFWVMVNFGQVPAHTTLRLLTPATLFMGLSVLGSAYIFQLLVS